MTDSEFDFLEKHEDLDEILEFMIEFHNGPCSPNYIKSICLSDVDNDTIKLYMEYIVREGHANRIDHKGLGDEADFFSIQKNHRTKPFYDAGGYEEIWRQNMVADTDNLKTRLKEDKKHRQSIIPQWVGIVVATVLGGISLYQGCSQEQKVDSQFQDRPTKAEVLEMVMPYKEAVDSLILRTEKDSSQHHLSKTQ